MISDSFLMHAEDDPSLIIDYEESPHHMPCECAAFVMADECVAPAQLTVCLPTGRAVQLCRRCMFELAEVEACARWGVFVAVSLRRS